MQRIEIPQYMERCVMEVVVNALAHRDYLIQGSEVHVGFQPSSPTVPSLLSHSPI